MLKHWWAILNYERLKMRKEKRIDNFARADESGDVRNDLDILVVMKLYRLS